MIENLSNGRAIIKQDFSVLSIEIPSRKNGFVIIFMIAWLGGWAVGEYFAVTTILHSDTPLFAHVFILFWLLGWTAGGAFVVYTILWQLMGREIITVEWNKMTIEKSVFGIGRKRIYEIRSIKNLDINPIQEKRIWRTNNNRNGYAMKSGKIQFDYGMKTIKFANDVDAAEAKMILEKLKANTNFNDENFALEK